MVKTYGEYLTEGDEKKLRIKGHKLISSTSGSQGTYYQGRCECGKWSYRGWTDRKRPIHKAHQNHLKDVSRT
jgi:hypothetical protein